MKFSKDQFLNLILFVIILFVLFYVIDKKSLNELSKNELMISIKKRFKKIINNLNSYLDNLKERFNNLDVKDFDKNNLINNGLNTETISICNDNIIQTFEDVQEKNLEFNSENSSEDTKNKNLTLTASQFYSENLNDKQSEEIYDFLQTLIEKDDEDLISEGKKVNLKKYKISKDVQKNIITYLINRSNNKKFSFREFKILNNPFYLKSNDIIEVLPLQINCICKIKKNKELISVKNLKLQIEMTFKFDRPDEIFVNKNKFLDKPGIFKLNRISILGSKELTNDDKNDDIKLEETIKNSNLKLSETDELKNDDKNEKEDSIDPKIFDSIDINNSESSNSQKIKYSYQNFDKSSFFEVTHGSETINSIIPDRIDITDNSPVLNQHQLS